MLEIGHAYSSIGNSKKAVENYLDILNNCDNEKMRNFSYLELARESVKLKQYDLADMYYEKLENTKIDSLALSERARMKKNISDFDTAKSLYFKLLNSKNNKYVVQAYYNLAEIEYAMGNYNKAKEYLSKLESYKFQNRKLAKNNLNKNNDVITTLYEIRKK